MKSVADLGRRWPSSARSAGACWPSPAARRSRRSGSCSRRCARTRSPTASTRGSSPTRCCGPTTSGPPRPSGWRTASTSTSPTGGCSSATTSPPSPAPARWSGPVLAAQMGYLPGTIWIVVGVIFAGAVQDLTVMFFSMRRNGKSLGQMVREEIGIVGGIAALIAVFAIMIIILAVLALIVVNALAESPVGRLLHRADDPDRPLHGHLPAPAPAGQGARGDRHRRGPAAAGDRRRRLDREHRARRRADAVQGVAGPRPGDLRLRRLGAAGLAAAHARATTCRPS